MSQEAPQPSVSFGDGLFIRVEPRTVRSARWNSEWRNHLNFLDFNFPLVNIPKKVMTRVDTQCIFCGRRIWKGQYRFSYNQGYGKHTNHRRSWFQLHEHCYYALVELCIEKLRRTLPSNQRMGDERVEERFAKREFSIR